MLISLIILISSYFTSESERVKTNQSTMSNTANSFASLDEDVMVYVADQPDDLTDNHNEQSVEHTGEQYDEQCNEQYCEQPDEPVDYTIGDEELAVIALCNGYLALWNAKDEEGNSLAEDYDDLPVSDAGPRVTSWAFLAAMDDLRIRAASDPTQVPVLCAIARTKYPQMARAGLRMDPLPLSEHVHRVFVDRDAFDARIDPTSAERSSKLGQSSVWTLAKWLNAQWRAGVNRCFHPNLRDLPLVPPSHEAKVQGKGKGNGSQNSNDNRQSRNEPVSRCPEDSAWNRLASPDLVGALYDIKDAYNRMLCSSPDLSMAYREHGRLRRERRDAEYAQRKADYDAQRKERNKNPPKDFKPQGRSSTTTQGKGQSKPQANSRAKAEQTQGTGFNSPARTDRVRVQRVQRAPKPKTKPQVDDDGFVTVGRVRQLEQDEGSCDSQDDSYLDRRPDVHKSRGANRSA